MNWGGVLIGFIVLLMLCFNIRIIYKNWGKSPIKHNFNNLQSNKGWFDDYYRNRTHQTNVKPFSDPLSSSLGSSLPHNVFNTSYRSGKY